MKVYLINSVYRYGSTGHICSDIKEALIKAGHKCRVAYGRKKCENEEFYFQSPIGVVSHMIFSRITDRHGEFSCKETKKLIKDIKHYEPDIIHLHNIHGYYLNYKILFNFLKEYDRPIVWTLHDCWAFTGHCSYFDAIDCEKWKEQCFQCTLKKDYPKSIWIDRSFENYNKKRELFLQVKNMQLITPSKWLADRVAESFFGVYSISVIYNGIDLQIFYPRGKDLFRKKYGLSSNTKIILGVAGVWSERKGLRDFIELSKVLPEEYKIVLVGQIEQKSEDDKILYIEHTTNQNELAEIYSAADVYFNASVEETMGLTTVEALACNTPVIVYNRTAIPEVVPKGCGIVLEPGDIMAVKCAVEKLVSKKEYNYCEKIVKFDKRKQYAKYIELYNKVVER